MILKIILSKLLPQLPGASELTDLPTGQNGGKLSSRQIIGKMEAGSPVAQCETHHKLVLMTIIYREFSQSTGGIGIRLVKSDPVTIFREFSPLMG